MIDITINLDTKKLNEIIKELPEECAKAFTDVILNMTSDAVQDAPVDLGDLRGSGFAEINRTKVAKGNSDGTITIQSKANFKNKFEGIIGFTEPYALRQHEELEYQHPKGGKSKYLEDAVNRNMQKSINHLKNAIKKVVD